MDNLKITVVDSIDTSELYDIYLANERVLTDVKAHEASSYIMKHQRKLNSIMGHNQRQLDYLQRWQNLAQSHAEANKNKN